jgi:hypothetical protein
LRAVRRTRRRRRFLPSFSWLDSFAELFGSDELWDCCAEPEFEFDRACWFCEDWLFEAWLCEGRFCEDWSREG